MAGSPVCLVHRLSRGADGELEGPGVEIKRKRSRACRAHDVLLASHLGGMGVLKKLELCHGLNTSGPRVGDIEGRPREGGPVASAVAAQQQ